MAHFDWYQASVADYPRVIADALMASIPGAAELVPDRGRLNYHHALRVVDSGSDTLATLLHGGANGSPNVTGTGASASAVADVVRRHWPDHVVTRVDSAEDVIEADFPSLHRRLTSFALSNRLKSSHTTSVDLDGMSSTTVYVGKPSSEHYFRAYEKGKQLQSQGDAAADPLHVRFEHQFRPLREGRSMAATMIPDATWGCSPWTARLAAQFLEKHPERVVCRSRLKSTNERRWLAMCKQYGSFMDDVRRRAPDTSWEALGAEIGRRYTSP